MVGKVYAVIPGYTQNNLKEGYQQIFTCIHGCIIQNHQKVEATQGSIKR